MASIKRVNRLLQKQFDGAVSAVQQQEHLLLRGEMKSWSDIVSAGFLAAKHNPLGSLVNDIVWTGGSIPSTRLPAAVDDSLNGTCCDVLIIGGGVTGCAIARELTRHKLSVLLVEKECDVALHASSRNDGMVHPGIDLHKNSEKYRYNLAGNAIYGEICEELSVEFKRCGQYLCFKKKWMTPILYLSLLYWRWMRIPAQVMNHKQLFAAEPNLAKDISHALFFPSSGIVCPYGLTIALAENAVQNGARLSLDTAVLSMELAQEKITAVHTNRGTIHPRIVVNAAGVFAEDVAKMANDRFFSIHPRRGTNSILDKKYSGGIAQTIAASFGTSSSKSGHTKGGGIVSTVHGNLLLGPDAVETFDKENFATQRESIDVVFEKQIKTAPALSRDKIITWFAGVRAPSYEEDFVVCAGHYTRNIVHAAGIQSPGLTAAPAIGQAVAKMAVELLSAEKRVEKNAEFNPMRVPIPHTAALTDEERAALIAQQPDYGEVLCRCEEVSRGEVLAALRRPVPCRSIDGVKRRVRPGMGRCQGGFCGPLVAQVLAEELGIPLEEVLKNGDGSAVLNGENKALSVMGGVPL